MNTWFRKEDLWIPVIVLIFLFFGFLFWCIGNDKSDQRRVECTNKGGEWIYLQYYGMKCLKELK
jgi:hypothetical protein